MDKWTQPPLADVPVEERSIAGLAGQPEVKIVIVNARAGTTRPAILHTHGGGYVLGAARGDVRPLQETAKALDCVCVSVDYRLAPETRWQGSTADNYAGLKWLHDHAGELGADRGRIAVMGESAGGGHAALLALMARDRGEVPLVLQVLVYPMLDDRTGTSRTVPPHIGSLLWTAPSNRYGWRSFLGTEPGVGNVPVQAVPARVADLAGLTPAWIGVGSIDLFVDEDIEYARRLVAAGVRTDLELVPGAFHGFDMDPEGSSLARQFKASKLNALRRAFGMPAVA
jgi:acetyl esterase/lipase